MKRYCTKCGLIFEGTPDRCQGCKAPATKTRKYEPFVIKGLTHQINKIDKEECEN